MPLKVTYYLGDNPTLLKKNVSGDDDESVLEYNHDESDDDDTSSNVVESEEDVNGNFIRFYLAAIIKTD